MIFAKYLCRRQSSLFFECNKIYELFTTLQINYVYLGDLKGDPPTAVCNPYQKHSNLNIKIKLLAHLMAYFSPLKPAEHKNYFLVFDIQKLLKTVG